VFGVAGIQKELCGCGILINFFFFLKVSRNGKVLNERPQK
jgi:hypothetical protein